MKPKIKIKIKLVPDGTILSRKSQWLHVEWFKIGGCKPRKYVDQIWLTENEAEATPVDVSEAKGFASDARSLAEFDGIPISKTIYLAKCGRRWEPTTLKAAK